MIGCDWGRWVTDNQLGLVLCDKNNNIWTEQKGHIWHFSGVRAKVQAQVVHPGAETCLLPKSSQSHLPSQKAGLYISPLPPHFILFSLLRSAARVNRIAKTLDPSKRKMCSKHCPALASGDDGALLCERLSAGAEMATVEACWSAWRAAQRWTRCGWWISLNYIWETTPLAASMNVNKPPCCCPVTPSDLHCSDPSQILYS